MAALESRDRIWAVGLRYTPALLPFAMMLAAMLAARASRGSRVAFGAIVVLLAATKMGRLTPFAVWADSTALRPETAVVAFHQPPSVVDRLLRTGFVAYLQSLVEPTPGTTARICAFLASHARAGDIVITNYAWESLYFHTRLPQGMKIPPTYPIYPIALLRGLPDYVFGATGARWIVWRPAWGAYQGIDIPRALTALADAGISVTRVATMPETVWENRENVHFRRFAGDRYIYPWFGRLEDVQIFRVDWPSDQRTIASTSSSGR
jgi:hypothetical protein